MVIFSISALFSSLRAWISSAVMFIISFCFSSLSAESSARVISFISSSVRSIKRSAPPHPIAMGHSSMAEGPIIPWPMEPRIIPSLFMGHRVVFSSPLGQAAMLASCFISLSSARVIFSISSSERFISSNPPKRPGPLLSQGIERAGTAIRVATARVINSLVYLIVDTSLPRTDLSKLRENLPQQTPMGPNDS